MAAMQPDEQAIFEVARKIDAPEARAAYLRQICGDDAALAERVQALLNAYEDNASFLEAPAVPPLGTIDEPLRERPGTMIGPYKLLEQIGEGGFGVVYMAEQTEPVRRKVALKILKLGMDTKQVVARFEAERQALAIMDHPNIARVFDGGATPSGRPYFVMELVKGVAITEFCDQNHLTPRQRLELFLPVCQAVQHAHHKGIIHRDLKPSNVLVSRHDSTPVPKVIDFGIAKALGQELTDKTLFTGFAQMVGTPLYMSPEQAGQSGLDIDTRSDIYSLGVLLYELLTGATPFDKERFKQAAYDEIRRIIREEDPPKPSTRLSDSTDSLPSISAQRKTEPAKLTKLVRGELDWIVMKTLEKDRNRRYEAANSLAADVQHYLADEPVQACPPSAWYRFRKFARRNKGTFVAGSAAAMVILLALIGLAVSNVLITQEKNEKVIALQEKEDALHAAASNYREARKQEALANGNEKTANEQRKQAQENLKDALAAVEQMLTRVAEDRLVHVPGMEPIRRDLLQDALSFYQKFLKEKSDDPVIRREVAWAYRRMGSIHHHLGQYAEAENAYRQAIAMLEKLGIAAAVEPGLRWALVNAYIEFSWAAGPSAKSEQAEAVLRRAVQIAEKFAADFPDMPAYRQPLFNASNNLASALRPRQPHEAETILRRNLLLAEDDFTREGTHRGLALVFLETGRLAEAEAAFRQALKHAETMAGAAPSVNWIQAALAHDLRILAGLLTANQRAAEADEYQRRAILISTKLATDFPTGPHYRQRLADAEAEHAEILTQLGRMAEAEKAYHRAVELYEKLATDFPSGAHGEAASAQRRKLGEFLLKAGRMDEVEALYRTMLERNEKLLALSPNKTQYRVDLAQAYSGLANILRKSGRLSDAEKNYRLEVTLQEKLVEDHPDVPQHKTGLALGLHNLAWVLRDQGHLAEAPQLLKGAIEHQPYPAHMCWHYHDLGLVLVRLGDYSAAAKAIERLLAIPQRDHWQTMAALSVLASCGRLAEQDPQLAPSQRQSITQAYGATAERVLSQEIRWAHASFEPESLERRDLPKLARRYCDLGRALVSHGRWKEAEPIYLKAADIYGKLIAESGANLAHRRGLAMCHNNFSWALATGPDPNGRDPVRAVALAKKAISLAPENSTFWNTLGAAHFRARNWQAAVEALANSMERSKGGNGFDYFFLAMAHWQLDQKEQSRKHYRLAVEWMEKNQPHNEELRRFRAEAEDLLKMP
jgi:eukaryotic-like serine/threonine-protein kinase